jgi:hypothetical protein
MEEGQVRQPQKKHHLFDPLAQYLLASPFRAVLDLAGALAEELAGRLEGPAQRRDRVAADRQDHFADRLAGYALSGDSAEANKW